jgi:hypothetical protein
MLRNNNGFYRMLIRKIKIAVVFGLVVHGGMFVSAPSLAPAQNSGKGHSDDAVAVRKLVDAASLSEATHLAAAYLLRACDRNGKFVYRINLNPDVTPKAKYNFLRHAGTIYALTQYSQAYPLVDTLPTTARAVVFLKKASIAPLPAQQDLLAVWSIPAITGSKKPLQAKLGGTGLGLVALTSFENTMPGSTPIDYLRKMAKFLLFMQNMDGSYYSKYYPFHGGKSAKWTSLYYPGEAALGLSMLYELDPDLRWLQSAADAIAYLAQSRATRKSVEADHWALLATARLLPFYERCRPPLPKTAIIKHAIQICQSILDARASHPKNSPQNGCFTDDGRTTPTAIRIEGLLAAYGFLPESENRLKDRIRDTSNEGIAFLLRSQIPSGANAGAIPRAIRDLPEQHPGFSKSFNRRATEVRIDYVQHALSAMIQYADLFSK